MTERERLIELLTKSGASFENALPEEIADYLLENGVIVLPCKAGHTVYQFDRYVSDGECCNCPHYSVGGFGDPSECERSKDGRKHWNCTKIKEVVLTIGDIYFHLGLDDFGKEVFLTKEEAEQALKARYAE